jgi:hypothetical protein
MNKTIAFAMLATVALSTPVAAAVTIEFGGATSNLPAISGSVGEVDYTLSALSFSVAPTDLTNFSQFGAPLQLRRTAPGVGVRGGGSSPQLDTNQPNRREAFLFSASSGIEISGLRLSFVDANDTLLFFGVKDDGVLVPLINSGTIRSGLNGAATVVNQTNVNRGTSTLTFANPWGYFERYVFTTRVGGEELFGGDTGQGYRLDALTVNVVPEPRTWALLIAGFGLVGFAARRRPTLAA